MKYIKGFDSFVNEGASLVSPRYDTASLKWLDEKGVPLEVLKTNDTVDIAQVVVSTEVAGSKPDKRPFQLYYGLTVDPERNKKLGDEDPVFKITLDTLKNFNIINRTRALGDFVKKTVDRIRNSQGGINYVVSLGSTADLSYKLGEEINRQFGSSKHIHLTKYKFDNITQALDWEYISNYDIRVEKGEVKKPILDRIQAAVIRAIDTDKTKQAVIDKIRMAKSGDELRGILLQGDPKNRYYQYSPDESNRIFWKNEVEGKSFTVRSSGISFGGSREFVKSKYDLPKKTGEFGNSELVDAIIECIIGRSKMIFVDDNARTKQDISDIFRTIGEFVEKIKLDPATSSNMTTIDTYHKRFMAYVLIYIPTSGAGDIEVSKLAKTNKVNAFKQGDMLTNIARWIEEDKAAQKKKEEDERKKREEKNKKSNKKKR